MVDFGSESSRSVRSSELRHEASCVRATSTRTCYSGLRGELDPSGQRQSRRCSRARKRGVIFDVGHGGGSFAWRIAVPAMKAGFLPDSISTDLHIGSMNAGMKDMLNVMDRVPRAWACRSTT